MRCSDVINNKEKTSTHYYILMAEFKNIKKVGLAIICFEGTEHLYNIISAIRESVDYVSIGLQRLSYHGDPILNVDLNEIFRLRDEDHLVDNIVEIELDTTQAARVQETEKRNLLIQDAEDHGCSHVLVIDSDEYYTKKAFDYGLQQIDEHDYDMTYCQYVNYYHDYMHYLKYPFADGMYVPFVSKTKYRHSFECNDFPKPSDPTRRFVCTKEVVNADGTKTKVKIGDYHIFEWNEVKMHHLSWLRADIRKKLENWSSKKVFANYDDLIDRAVMAFEKFDEDDSNAQALMLFNTPGNKVDVTKFPRQFIHPAVDFMTRLRPAQDYKKVLFLSMSANCEPFNTLETVCNETWRRVDAEKYPNVKAEFWTYTETPDGKDTYVDMKNHVIYLKTEIDEKEGNTFFRTYSKTIEALTIITDKLKLDFDYIVRTNNSTWINVLLVCEFLSYVSDDSLFYCAKLYAGYFSAFNTYMGGQMMILSRRNVEVIKRICGSVATVRAFEKKWFSCDDNAIGAKLNQRFIGLKLPYERAYHTIGGTDIIDADFNEADVDFSCPVYQIKTYNGERLPNDANKMRKMNALWKQCDTPVSELYKQLIDKWYDKTISVLKSSKEEWFKLSKEEQQKLKFKDEMERGEALRYLTIRQKQLGYQQGIFTEN